VAAHRQALAPSAWRLQIQDVRASLQPDSVVIIRPRYFLSITQHIVVKASEKPSITLAAIDLASFTVQTYRVRVFLSLKQHSATRIHGHATRAVHPARELEAGRAVQVRAAEQRDVLVILIRHRDVAALTHTSSVVSIEAFLALQSRLDVRHAAESCNNKTGLLLAHIAIT